MPTKHNRPAALQRRSTSESGSKLALNNLNLQKLDSSSNLQLQVALNNATKDLPRGKGKKAGGRSNQPPTRTASDQIRSSSKLHLQLQQPHAQRTAGAPRLAPLQQLDATATTKSNKKSGFTLASPAVVAHEIEGEGDSDEWVSSESMSATPQNRSSDSESDDDDLVHNLPANLQLTGAALDAASPDDREPPTPTIPQVKMQPPTPVTSAKDKSQHRLSTPSVPNEVGTGAGVNDVDRRRVITSTGDGHPNAVTATHVDQESVEGTDYPHPDHRTRPEEGLASTPRPRAIVDRDAEPSRHLPPGFLSDPPHPDPSARKPPIVNRHLGAGVQDLPQQRTLSVQSVPQSPPHTADDPSMTITQHQQQPRPSSPPRRKNLSLSSPPSPTRHRDKDRSGLSQTKHATATKRSGVRPPSLHSPQPGRGDHSPIMVRPHPLIRGPSPMTGASSNIYAINTENTNGSAHQNGASTVAFGPGVGKLAPLTTVTAAPSLSSSPPSLSPISLKPRGVDEGEVRERLRRQSIASVSSVNTQRSLGRTAGYEYANQASGSRNPQRERTMSTLSSSSYAALSALYPSYSQQSTSSVHSPRSPGGPSHSPIPAYGFTSYFPSLEGDNVGLGGPSTSELMHMLLPAPYLSAHMTVLKGRSPIREAVERVSRARKAQSSQ